MNFSVATTREGDAAIVVLAGEVDLYTAPQLEQELVRVTEESLQHVVVDMTETTFIDSTTLGVLVGCLKRLSPSGRRLALVIPDRGIRRVFDITGLDRVFPIYERREAAIRSLPAGAAS